MRWAQRRPAGGNMSKKKRRQKSAKPDSGVQTDANMVAQQETGDEATVLSGDTEALSDIPDADSESVKELAAEGQYYEAEIVDAIENARQRPRRIKDAGSARGRRSPGVSQWE